MLGVDDDEVEVRTGEDLRDRRVADGEPRPDHRVSVPEFALEVGHVDGFDCPREVSLGGGDVLAHPREGSSGMPGPPPL